MNAVNFDSISLSDMQQEFQTALLNQQQTPPAFIVDTSGASSVERFNVYTEAYRLRLIEALTADYPALKDYLGDETFDIMAGAYIEEWPSNQFSIRWFGRYLPGFLAKTPPYAKQPDLREIATFEWALSESFDASESTSIGFEQLAEIELSNWPTIGLSFHPSLNRVDLNCNVPQIWQASNQKQSLPKIIEDSNPQAWVVWRHDLKLLFRSISTQEAVSLDAFIQGKCFAEVCECLCESLDEEQVAVNAAGFIQKWVCDGWIVGVKIHS